MTTPANITLQVAVNGGAPQTGAIQVAYGDSLVLSLVDPSGVKHVEYRIWEYPDGFTVPAGWTSVTNDDGVTYYRYTAASGAAAPAITLPAGTLWGKYFFSAEVNGRLRNGRTEDDLFDDRTAAFIPSLSGIGDVGFGETTQFDPHRQWAGTLKSLVRVFDGATSDGLARFDLHPSHNVASTVAAGGTTNVDVPLLEGKDYEPLMARVILTERTSGIRFKWSGAVYARRASGGGAVVENVNIIRSYHSSGSNYSVAVSATGNDIRFALSNASANIADFSARVAVAYENIPDEP